MLQLSSTKQESRPEIPRKKKTTHMGARNRVPPTRHAKVAMWLSYINNVKTRWCQDESMWKKNWIHPNPHELEVNSNKMQSSYLVGWWNYKVVKEKVVELNKRYAPNSTWALNNISRTKYNIKRQIQLMMHMREEPTPKGFIWCSNARWHDHMSMI